MLEELRPLAGCAQLAVGSDSGSEEVVEFLEVYHSTARVIYRRIVVVHYEPLSFVFSSPVLNKFFMYSFFFSSPSSKFHSKYGTYNTMIPCLFSNLFFKRNIPLTFLLLVSLVPLVSRK